MDVAYPRACEGSAMRTVRKFIRTSLLLTRKTEL